MQVTAALLAPMDTGSSVDEKTMTACNQTDGNRLLQMLNTEISFFDAGGYGASVSRSMAPHTTTARFTILHLLRRFGRQNPRSQCPLFSLVPPDKNDRLVPCHFIPLNKDGRSIAWLYAHGSQESLDRHYRIWLEDVTNALKTSS